ncbi:MAG: dihydroorotase [Candidatus Omnitrophica bacterium]|nr:dihydroorotase [Candidatus Omnitrophota bacterium]
MSGSGYVIRNARLIDPAQDMDKTGDLVIENGKIASVGASGSSKDIAQIDASGKVVMPGVVDMHVHLREPGREDKETVASGSASALRGGVTTVLAMPNTTPAIDTAERVEMLRAIIDKRARARVLIAGCLTRARAGRERAEYAQLKKAGVVALTDDGASVDDEKLMQDILDEAGKHDLPVICHCEDAALSAGGVVNLGLTSTRMGLRGISRESEFSRVARDIALAEKAGARIHIAHVSCRESVELIAKAKARGVAVTAETAPHYFSLTEETVWGFDTNFKMNPPLRGTDDRIAVRQGVVDGTIDVIASDHAPHTVNEKDIEFERAAFGVTGLETELAVSISEFIVSGALDWKMLVERLCAAPARILGVEAGTLVKGADADLVIVDEGREWQVRPEDFCSQSANSAFIGQKLRGVVEYTFLKGEIVYGIHS